MKEKLLEIIKNPAGKVCAIDLDKTLTLETAWDSETALNCKPNQPMIDFSNDLYIRGAFLVIHTARRHEMYEATIQWLNKNGVKFHSVSMGRMPSDLYICDKTLNIEDIIKPEKDEWKIVVL